MVLKSDLINRCKQLGIGNISNKNKKELEEIIDNYFKTHHNNSLIKNSNNDSNNNLNTNINDNTQYQTMIFDKKEIKLNQQQFEIVTSNIENNIRIIACAGSGKTTTIICRLKYLLDKGVNPEKILITTFNVDACQSIKYRIVELLGYMPNLTIGTIDSISRKFYYRYKLGNQNNFLGVSEYASCLLDTLNKKDDKSKMILDKYQYLFFDEFQDINTIQFDILQSFYQHGCKITVIGDDAQNIYSFRGSNIHYILKLETYIPDIQSYYLVYNYRSSEEIINFANSSIRNNKNQLPKDMISFRGKCGMIPIIKYYHDIHYQNRELIKHMVDLHYNKGLELDEICILSRNNYALKLMEEDIEKYNQETKDKKLNYVSLISNSNQDIKPTLLENHITLTSIHKSKGLEWKVVFLVGCEDKYFPSEIDEISIEEERRLFYVAVTRPKNILYICFNTNNISRFISEIKPQYYNFINFKSKYFDYLNSRNLKYFDSVTEMIEMLNEDNLKELRLKEIIPDIEIEKTKIHDSYQYQTEIDKYFLHIDYGQFIDRYISRYVGEKNIDSKGLKDQIANIVILAINLDFKYYKTYKKYENNFKCNIQYIKKTTSSINYKDILEKDVKDNDYLEYIDFSDISNITYIIQELLQCHINYKIRLEDIIVLPQNYLPANFKEEMINSLNKFKEPTNKTEDILEDIYKVSLCSNIYEHRRRLLYKDVYKHFIENRDILTDIKDKYISTIIENKLLCKYHIKSEEYKIKGEIDLLDITDKKIIDYKCSNSNEMKLEWFLQLLTYLALIKINKKKIKFEYLEIYNPLKGIIFKINISEWNKEKELLEYLYQTRENKINRNKKIKTVATLDKYLFLDI